MNVAIALIAYTLLAAWVVGIAVCATPWWKNGERQREDARSTRRVRNISATGRQLDQQIAARRGWTVEELHRRRAASFEQQSKDWIDFAAFTCHGKRINGGASCKCGKRNDFHFQDPYTLG